MMGTTAGPLIPRLKLPRIATRDIGAAVADAVRDRNFSGKQTRELLGQRDLNMTEVDTLIGKAIGKGDLGYVQVPDDQFRQALTQLGMYDNMARCSWRWREP